MHLIGNEGSGHLLVPTSWQQHEVITGGAIMKNWVKTCLLSLFYFTVWNGHFLFLIKFRFASTLQVFFFSTCQCTVCQSFQILSQKVSNLETMIRAFVVVSGGVRYYEIVILVTVLRNISCPLSPLFWLIDSSLN